MTLDNELKRKEGEGEWVEKTFANVTVEIDISKYDSFVVSLAYFKAVKNTQTLTGW